MNLAETEPKCETCRFWLRYEDDETGQCRRRPPEVASLFVLNMLAQGRAQEVSMRERGEWPLTSPRDWCGEHQPKPTTDGFRK